MSSALRFLGVDEDVGVVLVVVVVGGGCVAGPAAADMGGKGK
jgi:hypothetical protein